MASWDQTRLDITLPCPRPATNRRSYTTPKTLRRSPPRPLLTLRTRAGKPQTHSNLGGTKVPLSFEAQGIAHPRCTQFPPLTINTEHETHGDRNPFPHLPRCSFSCFPMLHLIPRSESLLTVFSYILFLLPLLFNEPWFHFSGRRISEVSTTAPLGLLPLSSPRFLAISIMQGGPPCDWGHLTRLSTSLILRNYCMHLENRSKRVM